VIAKPVFILGIYSWIYLAESCTLYKLDDRLPADFLNNFVGKNVDVDEDDIPHTLYT
jgi:hypothetical protein